MKKVLTWVGNCFFAFLVIIIALAFTSNNETGQPYSILGFQLLTVLSGSMEPLLHTGDIVVSKKPTMKQVNVGDVVTYQNEQGVFVTHRVIDLVYDNGHIFLETKGDANNIKDKGLVASDQLVGSMLFHIPKLGHVMNFIKTPLGIFILVTGAVIILGMKPVMKFIGINDRKSKQDITT